MWLRAIKTAPPLSPADVDSLETWCNLGVQVRAGKAPPSVLREWRSLGSSLGLTPTSRASLEALKAKKKPPAGGPTDADIEALLHRAPPDPASERAVEKRHMTNHKKWKAQMVREGKLEPGPGVRLTREWEAELARPGRLPGEPWVRP